MLAALLVDACDGRRVEEDGGVAQDDGHTPAIGLRDTCSLGLWRLLTILDIPVLVNSQLSKHGIR